MPLVADITRYIQDLRSGAELVKARPQRLRRIGAKPREVSCVQHLQCCQEIFDERWNQIGTRAGRRHRRLISALLHSLAKALWVEIGRRRQYIEHQLTARLSKPGRQLRHDSWIAEPHYPSLPHSGAWRRPLYSAAFCWPIKSCR